MTRWEGSVERVMRLAKKGYSSLDESLASTGFSSYITYVVQVKCYFRCPHLTWVNRLKLWTPGVRER